MGNNNETNISKYLEELDKVHHHLGDFKINQAKLREGQKRIIKTQDNYQLR